MKKTLFVSLTLFLASPKSALAAIVAPGPTQIFQIPNFFGFTNIGQILKSLVNLAFFVAGLAFFANLLIGGIQWINAGGDQKAMQSARGRITNSVIGLIIVVAAYAITLIFAKIFGLNIFGFKFS